MQFRVVPRDFGEVGLETGDFAALRADAFVSLGSPAAITAMVGMGSLITESPTGEACFDGVNSPCATSIEARPWSRDLTGENQAPGKSLEDAEDSSRDRGTGPVVFK